MSNTFGIEIEFFSRYLPHYKLKEIFDKTLCQYRQPLLCNRENKEDWAIKRDSSCEWEIILNRKIINERINNKFYK